MRAYNQINLSNGYGILTIISPKEVNYDEQPSKKEFDCIAMKREAQSQIYDETKNLTPQQQIEYFRNAIRQSRYEKWWKQAHSSSGEHITQRHNQCISFRISRDS